jgi:hypothetical protein
MTNSDQTERFVSKQLRVLRASVVNDSRRVPFQSLLGRFPIPSLFWDRACLERSRRWTLTLQSESADCVIVLTTGDWRLATDDWQLATVLSIHNPIP